jgi:single-strand DNA-binding protein
MYQKIMIAGNLGRDPEMRYMPDGTAMTSFSVAVADGFGDNKKTLWFRVTVWGKRAETANQYLTKGQKVLIEGRLQGDANTGGPRMWTRQDGSVGTSFEIRADNFTFLSSRAEAMDDGGYSDGDSSSGGAVEEDDIPF